MQIKTLTVSALNNYIKKVIDCDYILNNVSIKGEISNFKIHTSGHAYFSLKDENSKINCVMFKNNAMSLTFMPRDGIRVIARGRVAVYEKDGSYQLYCTELNLQGEGELYAAFNNLKDKLAREGLFDASYKKPIPKFPRKIGIITSPTGAAVRDIINVTKRRNSSIEILIYPSLVQGINASPDIVKGIQYLNSSDVDVIIMARGGGSIEELWAFNDEALAYAVFKSKKPIITGVGHETDFTIVDFVSDRRAPTPSAAAEIAVPLLSDINTRIAGFYSYFNDFISKHIKDKYAKVDILRKELEIKSPSNHIVNQYNFIDKLSGILNYKIQGKLSFEKQRLSSLNSLISAHNPLSILNKGYAVIEDSENNIIRSIETLRKTSKVKVILSDGDAVMKIAEDV